MSATKGSKVKEAGVFERIDNIQLKYFSEMLSGVTTWCKYLRNLLQNNNKSASYLSKSLDLLSEYNDDAMSMFIDNDKLTHIKCNENNNNSKHFQQGKKA